VTVSHDKYLYLLLVLYESKRTALTREMSTLNATVVPSEQ
jgi:hypothetical protein